MNKKIIYLIVILAIFGIGGYFIYGIIIADEQSQVSFVARPIEVNFKTKIFSDKKFIDLKNNIVLPIKTGQKGKTNPFMKF